MAGTLYVPPGTHFFLISSFLKFYTESCPSQQKGGRADMWIYHQITQKHLFSFWNTITVVRPSLFYCVSMIYYTRIRNTNTLSCWTELGQRWFKTKTCFLKVINKLSPEAEWIFCIPFSRKISYWSMKINSHLKNPWDKCRRWSCLSKDHAHLTSWLLYNPFTQKKKSNIL